MTEFPLRLSRWALGCTLLAAAVAAWTFSTAYRVNEAQVEAWLVNVFSPVRAVAQAGTATVWTGMGGSNIMGFNITSACSSAALMGGFCTVTGVLLLVWRARTKATLVAALLALVIVFGTNMLRLSAVIAATRFWGPRGFEWSHVYLGTAMSVLGLFLAAGTYLFVLMRGTGRRLPGVKSRKAHRA